jgi:hypothetical protein
MIIENDADRLAVEFIQLTTRYLDYRRNVCRDLGSPATGDMYREMQDTLAAYRRACKVVAQNEARLRALTRQSLEDRSALAGGVGGR